MIPTRLLVGLVCVPLLLSIGAVVVPGAIWPMLAIDLILFGVAAVDVLLARAEVRVTRTLATVQAVGRPFDVTLHAVNRSRRPLSLRLHDDAPGPTTGLPSSRVLAPGMGSDIVYQLRIETRGKHAFGPVTVRCASPLGLWERQHRITVDGEARVYPDFRQLRSYGLEARQAEDRAPVRSRRRPGGENEFERLRPYVAGDPFRSIDWKATARRRSLITREFAQESNQNLIFLLDAGRMMSQDFDGLTAFDHALNAAMMMGQTALRHGDRVGLLAFDREVRAWLPPKGGKRSGGRLIRATYDLFPTLEEPDYALAFRWLGQRVRRRSLVVLLTSVIDTVNAEMASQLVRAIGTRHLALSVWIRDPGLDQLVEASPDPYARAAAAEVLHWRQRTLSDLRHRGALVVDSHIGQLTPALIARYLEVKARRLL